MTAFSRLGDALSAFLHCQHYYIVSIFIFPRVECEIHWIQWSDGSAYRLSFGCQGDRQRGHMGFVLLTMRSAPVGNHLIHFVVELLAYWTRSRWDGLIPKSPPPLYTCTYDGLCKCATSLSAFSKLSIYSMWGLSMGENQNVPFCKGSVFEDKRKELRRLCWSCL